MSMSVGREFITVTLFERLGGAAGIRRIVDGAIAAHLCNPVIRERFVPYEDRPEYVEEVKQHTCDFFAAGAGGPDNYRGRSMAEAHRGMNINAAEYEAASDDILKTMSALNYDSTSCKTVREILRSLEKDILHK
ncbi:group I truncated hemoglobin [Cribrihabitans pelagius]|uniref:group I truncated hemoglobin n=1 Tax=Cribrihabitans pelagius TaxID=1765746 RepID=UPI003B59B124